MNNEKVKKYLAFDTSSTVGAVTAFEVIANQKKIITEWSLSLEAGRHSERLLWTIDVVLQSAGWSLQELDGIVIGVGPGSFTGLRIGITTARMLAMQLKIKLYPISSLALLARAAAERVISGSDKNSLHTLVIACTDAAKGEWFSLVGPAKAWQNYIGQTMKEKTLAPEKVLEIANAYLKKSGPKTNWIAVGQAVERYDLFFKKMPVKKRIVLSDFEQTNLNKIQASVLAELGFEAIKKNLGCASEQVLPRYLRESDAEVKLKKGLLNSSVKSSVSPPLANRVLQKQ